jgi:hypothetical protein
MKKHFILGALCMCTLIFCSCEKSENNRIVGTWKYDTPEWHGMTTHHEMTFEPNGDYELLAECIDRGRVNSAVTHGYYQLNGERLTIVKRGYQMDVNSDRTIPANDTTEFRVAVNGNKLYLYDDVNHATVIYRR